MQKRTRGMTLVELLVATALTLVLVAAIAEAFAMVTGTISSNRATIELAGRVRQATVRLQEDLAVQTVPMLPWTLRSAGLGYFEYVEGPRSDVDADNDGTADVVQTNADTSFGDIDDVVMFTARSSTDPFVGHVLGTLVPTATGYRLDYNPNAPVITPITSELAEIVWFTLQTTEGVRLYRRVLLIRPDIEIPNVSGNNALQPSNPEMPDAFFFSANDLSVRYVGNVRVTNSLADLTRRENRFLHVPANLNANPSPHDLNFPNPLVRSALTPKVSVWRPGPDGAWGTSADDDADGTANDLDEAGWAGSDDVLVCGTLGTDVMANDVRAFDVRAYDPMAPIMDANDSSGAPALVPGDPGFAAAIAAYGSPAKLVGLGAYVDLGYAVTPYAIAVNLNTKLAALVASNSVPGSLLAGPPAALLGTAGAMATAGGKTYCTWTLSYENDGLDQDQDAKNLIDQGTNGLDDDNANGVDDAGERETMPPYNVALRGIQIRLRVIDPDSRQVRQMTIVSDFLPE